MEDAIRKVRQFHEAFGVPVADGPLGAIAADLRALRLRLLEEELDEYRAASAAGDVVAVADALHWKRMGLQDIKAEARAAGFDVFAGAARETT